MSFVDARPPSATVKAVEDSTVFVFALPKAVLRAKLAAAPTFAPESAFYRALAIYLSTIRERHRALGGQGTGAEGEEEFEADEVDELDANVLDGVYLAGERFDRMVKRVLVA